MSTKKGKQMSTNRVNIFEPGMIDLYKSLSEQYASGFSYAAKTQKIKKERASSEYIFLIITMGAELGLSPMQSINNIDIINGQLAIWGDGMLAVVRNSNKLQLFKESFSKTKNDSIVSYNRKEMQEKFYTDDYKAVCKLKREGYDEQVYEFSVKDARLAKLWAFNNDKQSFSPWHRYPDRMLQMRARSWALRDNFADHLNGLYAIEEARDIEHAPEKVSVVKKKIKPLETKEIPPEDYNSKFQSMWLEKLNKRKNTKEKKEEITSKLSIFVEKTAAIHNVSVESFKESAVNNFNDFLASFRTWYNKSLTIEGLDGNSTEDTHNMGLGQA